LSAGVTVAPTELRPPEPGGRERLPHAPPRVGGSETAARRLKAGLGGAAPRCYPADA